MSENKNDSEIPGVTPTSIKMDLIRFKNDILRDIRTVQICLDDKYIKADDFLKERITNFEIKINSFEKKISELSNLIVTDTTIREKVESLCQFQEEMRDIIFKRRAKYNEFEKQTKDDINKISKILTDSVIYPGIIGNSAKFQTFHEFMDYVLKEISQLCIFKEKCGLDLTPFKRKIDLALDNLKLQMNNFCSKDLLNTSINQSEEKIQSLLKVYNDRLQDTRVENSHYVLSLKKKTEEITKQIEILKKFKNKLNLLKENEDLYNNINNEIFMIKNRIFKMNEILKELLSYHPSSKKAYMNELEKKSSKIVSAVKQYIKGNLNANELSSMKKFTVEKSNSKAYDKSYASPSPNTSPFQSPDIIKNNNYKDYQKRNSYNINNGSLYFMNSYSNNSKDNNNNVFKDKKKNFLSQKSLNMANKSDSLNKKFNEEEFNLNNNINNNSNNKNFRKNMFLRRKTFNYGNSYSLESSKLNNEPLKDLKLTCKVNDIKKIIMNENKHNLKNDEHNNINNLSRHSSNKKVNTFNDSFTKEEEENKIKNELNQNSKIKSNNNSNEFIIKEEDENAISDNSTKNLESMRTKKEKADEKDNKRRGNNSLDIKDINNFKNNILKTILNDVEKCINQNNNLKTVAINLENNIKSVNFNEKVNFYNSENNNNNKKLTSITKKQNKNNSESSEPKSKTFQENGNNKNELNPLYALEQNNFHYNKFKEKNSIDSQNDNIQNIPYIESNYMANRRSLQSNSSFPKPSKNPINNIIFPKNNSERSPLTPEHYNLQNDTINNLIDNRYKVPVNYNFKQNNNVNDFNNLIPNKNINKTFTNFPKIKQDISEQRISTKNQKNNIEQRNANIIAKTLSAAKFSTQAIPKVAGNINKPKKVLLTNPENMPVNVLLLRKKNNISINKTKSLGNQSDKSNKTNKLENINNHHQSSLPYQLNSTDEERSKPLKNVKKSKSP